jgi:hypothetical protein
MAEGRTMPVVKRVLCPQRLRRVPSQFSWIDHRLVRDRHICRCSHPALALYLFLITVCDGEGLSYYSDASIVRLLKLDQPGLVRARHELINARLIAYQCPLYQVLALDSSPQPVQPPTTIQRDPGPQPAPAEPRERLSEAEAIGQIFKRMLENAP